MGSKRFKPKRFEAKRFEAKKIQFKKQDTAAIDKSYLETLERNKIWGENISKFFAPIKKVRTDFIVEKAAELGVAQIFPVQTDFTNSERIKQERLQTHAIEASEQCGGTFVPKVHGLQKLHQVLSDWPGGRRLMFCDEATAGEGRMLANAAAGPWAILIGPEGGFSKPERKRLNALTQSHAVSLGPRILRADTAVVAAITLWQAALGDWK